MDRFDVDPESFPLNPDEIAVQSGRSAAGEVSYLIYVRLIERDSRDAGDLLVVGFRCRTSDRQPALGVASGFSVPDRYRFTDPRIKNVGKGWRIVYGLAPAEATGANILCSGSSHGAKLTELPTRLKQILDSDSDRSGNASSVKIYASIVGEPVDGVELVYPDATHLIALLGQ